MLRWAADQAADSTTIVAAASPGLVAAAGVLLQLRGNNLSRPGEEALGDGLEVRGGYGSGLARGWGLRAAVDFWWDELQMKGYLPFQPMSEEQLTALLAKLQDDASLKEKFQGAADLDAAVAMAQEAGFDVSKEDWLKRQAQQTLDLSDDELGNVAGGAATVPAVLTTHSPMSEGRDVTFNVVTW